MYLDLGYVSLVVSFNFTIINIFKTRDNVYICAHAPRIGKVFYRKLNVADFPCKQGEINTECKYRKLNITVYQCKHKGKYTLTVNID